PPHRRPHRGRPASGATALGGSTATRVPARAVLRWWFAVPRQPRRVGSAQRTTARRHRGSLMYEVFGGPESTGGAAEPPGERRPQRGVVAMGIEVPAGAPTRGPHRAPHPPMDIAVVGRLRFRPDLHRGSPGTP